MTTDLTPEALRVLADHAVIFADGSHCCSMRGMSMGHDEDCPAGKLYALADAWAKQLDAAERRVADHHGTGLCDDPKVPRKTYSLPDPDAYP